MTIRKWGSWVAACAAAFLVAACGGGGGGGSGGSTAGASPSALSFSVRLNTTTAQVGVTRSLTLSATVTDSNGNDVTANSNFNWSSTDNSVATIIGAQGGNGVVTGVNPGNTTIQLQTTVNTADHSTHQLSIQTASISVVGAGTTTYALSIPNPSLSMTDGQSLPVTVAVVDSNGNDVTAQATGWGWSSSGPAVTVTPNQSTATFVAHNSSTTDVASANVAISVTAPNGAALGGLIGVTVQKNGGSSNPGGGVTYRVALSQNGTPITALSVLNGYPQVFQGRVLNNSGQDVTADFDGQWVYTATSPTLTATDDGAHNITLTTTRAIGSDPAQSTLEVKAVSNKLSTSAIGDLTVTEQPAWALVNQNAGQLVLTQLVPLIPVTAHVFQKGVEVPASSCTNWQWTSTPNVILSPSLVALDNQRNASVNGTGDFTITASCTPAGEQTPIQIVFPGTIK